MPEMSQMNGRISLFRPVSYAVVAENKALNSMFIEATPIEDFPMVDGQITGNVTANSVNGVDATGASFQVETRSSATYTAKWLAMSQPNRLTPPDVRRGEYVMLYQYGDDVENYYWVSMHADLSLRKLETVIFGISATADEAAQPDDTNSYVFGFSSHQKRIWLTTSKANKEPYSYAFEFDLANGKVTLSDDVGTEFLLDSDNDHVRIKNRQGSFMEIIENAFNIFTHESGKIETKDLMLIADTLTQNIANSITTTTQEQTINATTLHNGNFNTGPGRDGGRGDMISSGDFRTEGFMEAKAGISTDGTVTGQTANFQVYENLPG